MASVVSTRVPLASLWRVPSRLARRMGWIGLFAVPVDAQVSAASGSPFGVSPTVSVGVSVLEFDLAGDQAFRGSALRAGAVVGRFVDITALAERWPDLGSRHGWALQVETALYPMGRARVSPYLTLSLGHFSASPRDASNVTGVEGLTRGIALGLHGRVWKSLGIRVEGVVRFDATASDDQLRGFVSYAGQQPSENAELPSPGAAVVVYWMIPLAGPWRFAEPGYALKTFTPLSATLAGGLTVALLHWRLLNPTLPGAYSLDTRAVLIMPGLDRYWKGASRRLHARIGPALTVMLEGPDDGLRAGAQLEFGAAAKAGALPLTAGLGWIWLPRGASGALAGRTSDQHGLLLHVGIGL